MCRLFLSLNSFKSGLLLAQPCVRVKGIGLREEGCLPPLLKGDVYEVDWGIFENFASGRKLSPKTCSEPKTIPLSLISPLLSLK